MEVSLIWAGSEEREVAVNTSGDNILRIKPEESCLQWSQPKFGLKITQMLACSFSSSTKAEFSFKSHNPVEEVKW